MTNNQMAVDGDDDNALTALGELYDDDDETTDQGLQDLSEVNPDRFSGDLAEFIDEVVIHCRPAERIDLRPQILEGICSYAKDKCVEDGLEFSTIASALSLHARLVKEGEVVDVVFAPESKGETLVSCLMRTEEGESFLRRVKELFIRVVAEEPLLARDLGLKIWPVSRIPNPFVPPVSTEREPEEEVVESSPTSLPEEEVVESPEAGFSRSAFAIELASVKPSDVATSMRSLVRAFDGESPEEALACVRENPQRVFAIVQSGVQDEQGNSLVSPAELLSVVDHAIGCFDDTESTRLVADHLSTDRSAELLGHGGESRVLGYVVSPEAFVLAVAKRLESYFVESEKETFPEPRAMVEFHQFVSGYANRTDWQCIMDVEVGHFRFGDYVLLSALITASDRRFADFDGVGITSDFDEGIGVVDEDMLDEDMLDDDEDMAYGLTERAKQSKFMAERAQTYLEYVAFLRSIDPFTLDSAVDFEEFGVPTEKARERLNLLLSSDSVEQLTMRGFIASIVQESTTSSEAHPRSKAEQVATSLF